MCGPVGPGSIQTRSKRQGRCHWSCAASQARAARIRVCRLRGPTASRALPRLPGPRVLTSTKTRVSPSRQTRSSSSGPLRQLRARMQQGGGGVFPGTAQGGLVVPARTVVPCRWPGRIGQAAQAGKKTHSRLPCRVPGPSSLSGSTPRNVSRCWRQGPRRCRAS